MQKSVEIGKNKLEIKFRILEFIMENKSAIVKYFRNFQVNDSVKKRNFGKMFAMIFN